MTYAECGLDDCEARPYRPEVGDRIRPVQGNSRNDNVPPVEHLVTAVGNYTFLALVNCEGPENQYVLTSDRRWEKIPDPVVYPEVWIAVYQPVGSQLATSFIKPYNRPPASEATSALGIIHLASDGTLTMEAP